MITVNSYSSNKNNSHCKNNYPHSNIRDIEDLQYKNSVKHTPNIPFAYEYLQYCNIYNANLRQVKSLLVNIQLNIRQIKYSVKSQRLRDAFNSQQPVYLRVLNSLKHINIQLARYNRRKQICRLQQYKKNLLYSSWL